MMTHHDYEVTTDAGETFTARVEQRTRTTEDDGQEVYYQAHAPDHPTVNGVTGATVEEALQALVDTHDWSTILAQVPDSVTGTGFTATTPE